MLTKKGKYGLKAMVHLAGVSDGQLVSASEIAERHHIPRKFLDNIFTELRNAGFVLSRKGKGGGFCLARPANEIHIGNIIRALDGALAPIACASKTDYQPCDDCDETECGNGSLRLCQLSGLNTSSVTRQLSSSAIIVALSIGSTPIKTISCRRSPHSASR